jgi:predicted transcriptional regulator YdeE
MKITNEKENERIDIDLNFLKPWKSFAKVWLTFKDEGENTRVNWGMDSSIPFFLFFMKSMMEAMIGMDYTRGLNMMKELIEEGEVHSKLDFVGVSTFEGGSYVGIKTATTIDKIGEAMSADYTKLMEHMRGKHAAQIAGNPYSIYHKWDLVKNQVEYTAAVPISAKVQLLPGMIEGAVPKTKVHTIHHKGKSKHIGNAWSAQQGRQQAKVFSPNKKIHPIEEYLNSPMDTSENDLEVNIHFAIK